MSIMYAQFELKTSQIVNVNLQNTKQVRKKNMANI